MLDNPALWKELGKSFFETLYMTLTGTAISYVLGIPLGVILYITDEKGITPCGWLNKILGFIVNVVRSVPFLLLLVYVLPLTRALVGTTIGTTAVIPPLVIASTPFIARMVESSLKEVDHGIIEAAESMGSTPMQLITKVLLPEARPSLLVGAAIAITTILGYSAMAGFVGGGGLGGIAINYGYYKYKSDIMTVAILLLIVIVQIFQEVGSRIALKADRRIRK